jgi:hypothetical protein
MVKILGKTSNFTMQKIVILPGESPKLTGVNNRKDKDRIKRGWKSLIRSVAGKIS